ncbi:rRNA small subunit methyltransferase H [hydrothermal vent metagenome]|uniref:rRNA small subunit methyltransferase H n=1 Tax=hydrothermal vent metagenome TaxID=652676 RepID=A0A1W1EJJ6_9ZZZZ
MKTPHIPVLLNEVLEYFKDLDDGYFIDCTLGYAGHSEAILKNNLNIKQIGIDRDIEALNFSKNRLSPFENRISLYKGKFSNILPSLQESPIRGVLADFGVSSLQLDKKDRGFGFDSDVLDMRMDRDENITAQEIVNEYSQEKLEYIFNHYGEIKAYRKLASAIIQARTISPITTAKELAQIALDNLYRGGKIHPATLMFQAIRIEVNKELQEIELLLETLEKSKPNKAIIALITFHSLEDRLVKNRFKKWATKCICDANAIRCRCSKDNDLGKIITKKPKTASKDELKINPRSRSAKLRVFRFH